ncbi:MAG TPA: cupredoxin domain-containing protein, partial [Aggregatilineales bacterium]|nr:cupredoxin domain-containing protein [Aggregatilineales bacterium]
MNRRTVVLLLMFGLLAVVWLWLPLPHTAAAATRRIEINAAEYAYTPGRIHVNHGDQVVITLTSSDVVHGFYLDGYSINERVIPGIEQRFEFTADQTGKFRYRCSVSCGSLHPFMIGELVVSPNKPF